MRSHSIGKHTLVYGDDGISIMTYDGDVSAEEMKQIMGTEDLANTPEVVMLICNMRDMGRIDSEARSMGARSPKPAKRYLTAYIGAGFAMRVVADMFNRATNILQGKKKYVGAFFQDEESARAWLLAQKEAFEKGAA